LLNDLLQHPGMAEVPPHKTWVTSLCPEDLDANLFAFRVLSFAVMVGQNLDSELAVHLVPLLIWNEFSVDWLASWSIKSIRGMLEPLGLRPNVAKMLCNLAIAICHHHGGVVPNREEDLEHLPGADFRAIQLVLRHGFDQNPVSYYAVFFFIK